jgi:hypothetical protein
VNPNCNYEVGKDSAICTKCGTHQPPPAPSPEPVDVDIEKELRTLIERCHQYGYETTELRVEKVDALFAKLRTLREANERLRAALRMSRKHPFHMHHNWTDSEIDAVERGI